MAALFPGLIFPQEKKPGLVAWTQHQTQGQTGVPASAGVQFLSEQFTYNVSDFAASSVTGDNITSLSWN